MYLGVGAGLVRFTSAELELGVVMMAEGYLEVQSRATSDRNVLPLHHHQPPSPATESYRPILNHGLQEMRKGEHTLVTHSRPHSRHHASR